MIADIAASWWKILIGVALALVACIIFIMMLRWIAAPMVWISIIGVVAGLSFCKYVLTSSSLKILLVKVLRQISINP